MVPRLQHFNLLDTIAKVNSMKAADTQAEARALDLKWKKEDRPGQVAATQEDREYNRQKREKELTGMDQDQELRNLKFGQARLQIARDHLPAVSQDMYGDYVDWMQNTMQMDTRNLPGVAQVRQMTPAQWEQTKKQLMLQADDVLKMDLEQLKQRSAMERTKVQEQGADRRTRMTQEGSTERTRMTQEGAMARTKVTEAGANTRAQAKGTDKEPWQDKIKREAMAELRERYRDVRDKINRVKAGIDIPIPSEDRDQAIANWEKELRSITKEYERNGGRAGEIGAEAAPEVSMRFNPDTGRLEPVAPTKSGAVRELGKKSTGIYWGKVPKNREVKHPGFGLPTSSGIR
jgi:hypothetical protein